MPTVDFAEDDRQPPLSRRVADQATNPEESIHARRLPTPSSSPRGISLSLSLSLPRTKQAITSIRHHQPSRTLRTSRISKKPTEFRAVSFLVSARDHSTEWNLQNDTLNKRWGERQQERTSFVHHVIGTNPRRRTSHFLSSIHGKTLQPPHGYTGRLLSRQYSARTP